MRTFTLNKALRVLSTNFKRTYINPVDTKGTYDALKKQYKYLSPINGLLFRELGAPQRLYDTKGNSASVRLVQELFYKHEEQFRNTQHKSKAGYSFVPKLIAKVIFHLHAGTLDLPETRAALYAEWKSNHKQITNSSVSMQRINSILDLISQSKKECGTYYPAQLTENILLAFLCYKADNRSQLTEEYLKELNRFVPVLEESYALKAEDQFTEADTIRGKIALINASNFDSEVSDFEVVSAGLIIDEQLPKVMQTSYKYQDRPPTANCVEAAFHNLCNALLKDGKRFNFSILPSTLKPNEKLVDLYQMQAYNTTMVNAPAIGQAFMNLVSGHDNLHYRRNSYELDAKVENFIPVMNYLFGSTATNLAELSEQFSDSRRKIKFREVNGNIEITMEQNDKVTELTFILRPGVHGDLRAPAVFQSSELGSPNIEVSPVCPPLLTAMLHMKKKTSLLLWGQEDTPSLPTINTLMIYYALQASERSSLTLRMMYSLQSFPELGNTLIEFIERYNINIMTYLYNSFFDRGDAFFLTFALNNLNIDVNQPIERYPGCKAFLLEAAIEKKDIAIVNLLLDKGANPNLEGLRLLEICYARNAGIEMVKLLLERGVNPNLQGEIGSTPVIWYCSSNVWNYNTKDCEPYVQIIKLLEQYGAKFDIKNDLDRTPWDYIKERPNLLTRLAEAGVEYVISKMKENPAEVEQDPCRLRPF